MEYKKFLHKLANTRLYVIPALEKAGFKQKAFNMYDCGSYKDYLICTSDYTAHFNGFSSCKDRFCPLCQEKRSRLYFARFVPVFRKLLKQGYYVNMLNFTITDTATLQEGLDILTKAFRYLQHENKIYRKLFKQSFAGGVICKEIKEGENSKLWHPHLHSLVVKDHFSKDFDWLKDAWNHAVKIAGGRPSASDPSKYGSVHICSVIDRKNLNTDKFKSVEAGCIETIKYITKFDWQCTSADKVKELITTLKGVRAINTWGILRKIDLNVENELDKSFNEIRKCCCTVCGGTDFYQIYTRMTLKNVVDFKDTDYDCTQEYKLNYTNGQLTRLVELKDELEVGQVYDGVMFTEEHEKLKGQAFAVITDKGKILKFNHNMQYNYMYFSKVMFKGY